jgi:hypothetical protein
MGPSDAPAAGPVLGLCAPRRHDHNLVRLLLHRCICVYFGWCGRLDAAPTAACGPIARPLARRHRHGFCGCAARAASRRRGGCTMTLELLARRGVAGWFEPVEDVFLEVARYVARRASLVRAARPLGQR